MEASRTSSAWLLRATVVGVALVVAVVAWLVSRDNAEPSSTAGTTGEARIVSVAALRELAVVEGHPVYWAGPMPGAKLEALEYPEGGVQVRYLKQGDEAGEGGGDFLTIGSYPLGDPRAALASLAAEPGAIVRRSPDGRRVVASSGKPTSVYFASPDNSVQVEVYDPSPRRAMSLALAGKVQPAR
jgi:hypothetical protein